MLKPALWDLLLLVVVVPDKDMNRLAQLLIQQNILLLLSLTSKKDLVMLLAVLNIPYAIGAAAGSISYAT